jgi:dTDP-4-dehydrorhamnose 3,5-epimerase-like enzyme
MNVTRLRLEAVPLIQPELHPGLRGSFAETFHRSVAEKYGFNLDYTEENISTFAGTSRGLHWQAPPPELAL